MTESQAQANGSVICTRHGPSAALFGGRQALRPARAMTGGRQDSTQYRSMCSFHASQARAAASTRHSSGLFIRIPRRSVGTH
jgi:hypothetical protein